MLKKEAVLHQNFINDDIFSLWFSLKLSYTGQFINFEFLFSIKDQAPSVSSVQISSVESDNPQKAKFSLTGSIKSKKLFKDKASFATIALRIVIDSIDLMSIYYSRQREASKEDTHPSFRSRRSRNQSSVRLVERLLK